MDGTWNYIGDNLKRIREACATRALQLGITPPTLIAVTKSATDDQVKALVEQYGQKDIAENRANLFCARHDLFAPEMRPRMHLIGQLQTNKVKYIIGKTCLIHSLDSLHLAAELEKQAARRGIAVDVLLEVNSGREQAKGGILPEAAEEFAACLADYPHVALRGVMTMAPVCERQEDYHPYFKQTAELFHRIKAKGLFAGEGILSMGMSGSYMAALEEGATVIRVGRALFAEP